MKNIIILTLALLFSPLVLSQELPKKSATVYFLNGVGKSSVFDVAVDISTLGRSLNRFCPKFTSTVLSLLNASNPGFVTGLLRDIFDDLATQKELESTIPYPRHYRDLVLANYGLPSGLSQSERLQLEEQVRERQVTGLSEAFSSASIQNKVATYRSIVLPRISQTQSVLVVAHSQGNLYSNQLHSSLMNSGNRFVNGGFFAVNVATPSAFTSHGSYYTARQDRVIDAARFVFNPPALPANIDLTGANSVEITGHNFAQVYLSSALPVGTTPLSSSAARLVRGNISFGFRIIYRPVNEMGNQGVADSSSLSPCEM